MNIQNAGGGGGTINGMDLFPVAPVYTGVSSLRGHVTPGRVLWIDCEDIYRELGIGRRAQPSLAGLADSRSLTSLKHVNVVLNSDREHWDRQTTGTADRCMVSDARLRVFAALAVSRSRKTFKQKAALVEKFGIRLDESEVRVPVECSVLDTFCQACPFTVLLQYRVGPYRVDAFIPSLRMVVEIDENGHTGYDRTSEREHESLYREKGIVCIRHTPDPRNPYQSAVDLVKTVWTRMVSPDFTSFQASVQV